MTCYHPRQAYQADKPNPNGKYSTVWSRSQAGIVPIERKLPCKQCIGCRLDYSRIWAIRIMHEAQMHKDNCYLTLTYDDDHLPDHGFLVKKHFQDFMKRYRRKFSDVQIRYYYSGEYGEKHQRPHYHACIFGHSFDDLVFFKRNHLGQPIYTSETLKKLWPYGYSSVGDLEFRSAAYVARYILKKVNGLEKDDHYSFCDLETGELLQRPQEFSDQSRGGRGLNGEKLGGIGKQWLDSYFSDVYPSDEIVFSGKRLSVPAYYDRLLERSDPDLYREIKDKRKSDFYMMKLKAPDEFTPERLIIKERCKELSVQKLKRNLD